MNKPIDTKEIRNNLLPMYFQKHDIHGKISDAKRIFKKKDYMGGVMRVFKIGNTLINVYVALDDQFQKGVQISHIELDKSQGPKYLFAISPYLSVMEGEDEPVSEENPMVLWVCPINFWNERHHLSSSYATPEDSEEVHNILPSCGAYGETIECGFELLTRATIPTKKEIQQVRKRLLATEIFIQDPEFSKFMNDKG